MTQTNFSDFDYFNLASLAISQNKVDEAIKHLKKAVFLQPNFPRAYFLLSILYASKDKRKETLEMLIKLAELEPNNLWHYNNLAIFYFLNQEFSKAEEAMQKCLELDPNFTSAYANLFLIYRTVCSWEKASKIEKKIEETQSDNPLLNVLRYEDLEKNYSIAKKTSDYILNSSPKINFSYQRQEKHKKIRLGYLSRDFRNHPIGHMTASLFGFHDRKKFSVYIYSYGSPDNTYWSKRPRKEADKFVDIRFIGDTEVAKLINQDEIDILIDLVSYTQGTRLGIAALRPAPIQLTWLGFPGTTGASFFDYILIDKMIANEEEQKYFSEKLYFLPGCYQINDCFQKISDKNFQRKDFNLPEKGVVFSCFHQSYKIEPVIFNTWAEILKATPKSVLWFWKQADEMEKNLKKEASKRNLDPKRLIFSPKLPNDEHLKRLGLTNIGLDTRIYGGHTTTSDYLRAGVPIITRYGSHFASRVASSILKTYGVPELITKNIEEYKRLAIELGNNHNKLSRLKAKIKTLAKNNPLFDTKKFVKKLEDAYQRIWENHLKNGH